MPDGKTEPPTSLPLFVRLAGRTVLVVGAGQVAARKIRVLLATGACVVVIGPEAVADVKDWAEAGQIRWLSRRFSSSDVVDHRPWLVIAATDDPAVDAQVASCADAEHTLATIASDGPRSSALFAPTVRREPFTIAVSSDGELPALTRLVCQVIEAVLPGERWVRRARALRESWKRHHTPTADRFAELVGEIAAKPPTARSDE